VTSSLGTFAGLGRREPLLGVMMTLFLLSLVGIPPTAGFFAKANVIIAAVEAGGPLTVLAVIMVLNAAVAAFYYLRVVIYMYVRDRRPTRRRSDTALLYGPGWPRRLFTILLGSSRPGLLDAVTRPRRSQEPAQLAPLRARTASMGASRPLTPWAADGAWVRIGVIGLPWESWVGHDLELRLERPFPSDVWSQTGRSCRRAARRTHVAAT
jgi:hypothetical protein